MVVIYAEKYSLAKEIANALHAGKRIPNPNDTRICHWDFNFKGEKAILVHGQGHLVQLSSAEAYGEQYKKWNLNTYPCIPEYFKLKVKDNAKVIFDYIKPFFEASDWIINATDADREGELIFDYIYNKLNCHKPWKRVWIEDLTTEKLQYAFDNLKPSNDMSFLQSAGEARAIADWLFGINITVALTSKFSNNNGVLACGRVQTPTLALVVNREKDIRNFQKKSFYKLIGMFTSSSGDYSGEYINGNIENRNEAEQLLSVAQGKGKITSKAVKQINISSPLLYNTTQLQIACSKLLGWDLKKAESVMQKLYEAKYMSYPRTNAEHLTVAMMSEIETILERIFEIPEYSEYKIPKENWKEFSKRHFDDEKVGSHPAITPTLNVPKSLTDIENEDMRQLYDVLCKSVIRIIYPSAVLQKTSLITDVNGVEFKSTGSIITNPGWYFVDAMPDKKNILPDISENDTVNSTLKIEQGETKPPKRYTEAELIETMELAGQKIEDEEARTLMKLQNKGLGTDATRVPTVESLFKREYITKKGKTVYPTEKGMYIINTLPIDEMKSADMTGELEKELNDIYLGKADYDAFINKIKSLTERWYKTICNSSSDVFVDKSMICPACGNKLVKGKTNVFCTGYKKGCKFSIPYSICGKKLTVTQIDMLIHSQRTNIIKGFTSKSGSTFDASLKIDNSGKIEFIFPDAKGKKK